MGKILAAITTSVDGYITGPDDRAGLGVRRRALHRDEPATSGQRRV